VLKRKFRSDFDIGESEDRNRIRSRPGSPTLRELISPEQGSPALNCSGEPFLFKSRLKGGFYANSTRSN